MNVRVRVAACTLAAIASGGSGFSAQDYKSTLPADDPSIEYVTTPAHDAASVLGRQLERGTIALETRPTAQGVLPALLAQLKIGRDSQMLVFSKTSVQAARISPVVPRAIYFNDDVTVAYVPGSPTLEVTAVDPMLGPIFYTVSTTEKPAVVRGEKCLRCHQGPNTAGVPGIYVGSVIPGPSGQPLGDDTAIITDHRTAFADRWGGWYVTAARGEQRDRANAVASNPADPDTIVRDSRQNLTSLAGLFDASSYPAGSSDIVALMTFEHQTQAINLITRVGWEARLLAAGHGGITPATLDADIDDLVAYLLFAGEAPLTEPVEGVSSFARTFADRGPRDRLGRSLRDFDLRTRLFRYRLSYTIYSAAFDGLPDRSRARVYRRLGEILASSHPEPAFTYLSQAERTAIVEILRETKPDIPKNWPR